MKPIDLLRGCGLHAVCIAPAFVFTFYCISDPFILQFVCKVNAENYSDHASSAPQQNKKVLSPCFQYTNSVKRKGRPLYSGGGGGGGRGGLQSLIKVRGSDSKVFTWIGSAVKMLPRVDTKFHFWHPRADTKRSPIPEMYS